MANSTSILTAPNQAQRSSREADREREADYHSLVSIYALFALSGEQIPTNNKGTTNVSADIWTSWLHRRSTILRSLVFDDPTSRRKVKLYSLDVSNLDLRALKLNINHNDEELALLSSDIYDLQQRFIVWAVNNREIPRICDPESLEGVPSDELDLTEKKTTYVFDPVAIEKAYQQDEHTRPFHGQYRGRGRGRGHGRGSSDRRTGTYQSTNASETSGPAAP